ncbi:hypothetical protein CALVIDRAFT_398422 [Calocera viscosa TUFC12733]|uniref:Uncharacterized protein n=1 Tax=Calocera viscosa (strain TUFC12733) TaxID=1330018 RepID=A0A167PS79_CALVF|nr:hypothetical protein CALVIDRAFT_398422 [Calocera viscosa TUFC12733]
MRHKHDSGGCTPCLSAGLLSRRRPPLTAILSPSLRETHSALPPTLKHNCDWYIGHMFRLPDPHIALLHASPPPRLLLHTRTLCACLAGHDPAELVVGQEVAGTGTWLAKDKGSIVGRLLERHACRGESVGVCPSWRGRDGR